MKKLLITSLMLVTVSGCSLMDPEALLAQNEVAEATTETDAVEGNTEPQGEGLIGLLRQREDAMAGDPSWSPLHPPRQPEHYTTATGSLFSIAQAQDLYDDTKPRGIGDIVTVLLEEKTQAKKSASTDANKSSDLSMDPLEMGGQEVTIGDSNLSYAAGHDNKTSGSTSADQSNSISGSISVEVIDVLANGNLIIRGEKWLTLNTGDEYIRLSGTIRPDDISQENTVASTRISNARIQYSGTGDRQDTQDQGWLARFFNVVL
ncbi:flagellar basal body L-ring protein FlgH [Enterovibrio norvegicus]|uniref:Flagellar L-ring protein n=2 Tax=Enterovibrio norvegicus TaxID=188144 RepID=A0A2N7L5U6_9GAMM|nr:flagellar basal body L-ring protein FlgH [Enterovibrio norvegicus]MCC4798959.1 flagellar basal body L-ring protein FlgH [Enterovibrio norvegicus]OEE61908.1 flagellar basal body L-ring protein [Enterovibrio norvegicus]OEF58898.1 flagellar basal body L-ring protein [Enterovibrio norvegicus]OEF59531.1 flagellar basal body L-ring protein [Enterovibrio norvegicus]PMH63163.1 flagellar basal body L-ring protein [Enterovibrio norvegicus]